MKYRYSMNTFCEGGVNIFILKLKKKKNLLYYISLFYYSNCQSVYLVSFMFVQSSILDFFFFCECVGGLFFGCSLSFEKLPSGNFRLSFVVIPKIFKTCKDLTFTFYSNLFSAMLPWVLTLEI